MKPFDPSILQLVRRFIMVIGFSFFVLFAYKATKDVSNGALASGSPFRKKPPIASLSTQPLSQPTSGYQEPSTALEGTQTGESAPESGSGRGVREASNTRETRKEKINPEYLQDAEPLKSASKKGEH